MSDNRNRFFIDDQVQLSLVRRVFWHWISFITLFLLVVVLLEIFFRIPGISVLEGTSISVKGNVLLIVLLLAVMPAFLYDAVKLSNRFAGPVSRLRQGLAALANGQEVEQMSFRKDDFWSELAEDFNRVARRLSVDQAKELEKSSAINGSEASQAESH